MRSEHVTRTPTNDSAGLLSCVCITRPVYYTAIGGSYGHVIRKYILIYTFWYNFDTVLCQFLETGTSDRCLLCIVQHLRFSGFILYPLSFFLYSPFEGTVSVISSDPLCVQSELKQLICYLLKLKSRLKEICPTSLIRKRF